MRPFAFWRKHCVMCERCVTRGVFLGGLAAVATSAVARAASDGAPDQLELAISGMKRLAPTVWVKQISERVWVHTTTERLGAAGFYPANGLVVEDRGSAILVDTGWRPAQTQTLVEFWRTIRKRPISRALVTHFHYDRLGGTPYLRSQKIAVVGNPLTIGLAIENALPPPDPLRGVERTPQQFGPLEVLYPGSGHTVDNVVAFVSGDGVLFGGCLVKSTTAAGLGNVADAVVSAWAGSVANVHNRYPDAKIVVPGHGTIEGDSLLHTIGLVNANG